MTAARDAAASSRQTTIGLGAFARRWLGVALWAAVDPRSLPERWAAPERFATGRGVAMAGSVLAGALALALGAATLAASARLNSIADAFAVIPEEASLEETAWRLDHALAGAWWAPAAPAARAKLQSLAERIRSGRSELASLAREYEAARAAVESALPEERRAFATRRIGALETRLEDVHSMWLRQTLTYSSVRAAVEPALEATRSGAPVPLLPPLPEGVEKELSS